MEIKTFPSIYLPQQGDTRIQTGDGGFAVLCLTVWLCHQDMGMPWTDLIFHPFKSFIHPLSIV
jgi:hypothetical protein